jgi:hypothetical protein
MSKKKTFLAGRAMVDSGTVYVGDPGYLVDAESEDSTPGNPVPLGWDEYVSNYYDGKHGAADGDAPTGVAQEPIGKGLGIAVKSGHGDGIYPVFVTLADDGTVESLMISFK